MTAADFNRDVFPLKNKIFRFAKRMLKIDADAEDITQEVFIKLWREQKDIQHFNNIDAFAMTITKHLCLDKLKSPKYQATTVAIEGTEMMQAGATPHAHAEQTDQRALMSRIIDGLPEQQKMIVHLREIEGYEFEEIVTITGMNMNVVRINLSRARKTIKEELIKIYKYGLKIS